MANRQTTHIKGKMVEFLKKLEELGLQSRSVKIQESILSLIKVLKETEDDIDDAILSATTEKRYGDIAKLSEVPDKKEPFLNSLSSILKQADNKEIMAELSKIKGTENKEDKNKDEASPFKGIITSRNELRVGGKLVHQTLGNGKIVSISDTDDGKVMTVAFNDCTKPFSCNKNVLEKFFGIVEKESPKEEKIQKIEDKTKGKLDENKREYVYNMYTKPELFTFKRPYRVSMLGTNYEVSNFNEVVAIILRELYNKDSSILRSIIGVTKKWFVTSKEHLLRPICINENNQEPLYIEGNLSSEDIIKNLSIVLDRYINVYNKDVRKETIIYLRGKGK